ncbi:putative spermidine/putrescine transport system substrate-binding protein [Mycobacterium frederiksbergense]|uniref:Spermidine/putrescine transport system substrate-binding protein n=1 Tax=Mycolicibacterium frederiksbergense TaxID=117567 RepID=A0ABT6KXI9_9MYCO|nr:ABC transporter substrate-binding protein [Mycolicibacterium frederiksbergense]MDH6195429.1 putative spermidine/putrescine transport system substrate-binding protein [Mycolicibacterium frederiksbergense]
MISSRIATALVASNGPTVLPKVLPKGAALAVSALVAVGLAACAPPQKGAAGGETDTGVKVAEARSAADFGGMDKLVEAAKAEGELNVIALPPDWANYGELIKVFSDKYGIKVDSALPNASSQEEINSAHQQQGKSTAPDVFDMGQSVALANTPMFAPYKVATFDDIPEKFKDPQGTWVNDYGGYMSIGFDSTKVPPITSVDDLLKPEYQGKVALNGDPTQAGAAFAGVVMVAVSQGGSADDIAPGVKFFAKLNEVGNFLPLDPTPATIESGQTPVVIDWNYLNGTESKKVPGWQVMVPHEALVAGYYFQAINKDAPHPAAARLWQEFLFSDEGQNLFAKGGVRPVRADQMIMAGTADRAAFGQLPIIDGPVTVVTQAQTDTANKYLADNWAKAIG